MKRVIFTLLTITLLVVAMISSSTATAKPKPEKKVTICHNGKTISVGQKAAAKQVAKGISTLGACAVTGSNPDPEGPGNGGGNLVTDATFANVNRVMACGSSMGHRSGDNSFGLFLDLTKAHWESGTYANVILTIARFYEGIGTSCDVLPGYVLAGYNVNGDDATQGDGALYPFYVKA